MDCVWPSLKAKKVHRPCTENRLLTGGGASLECWRSDAEVVENFFQLLQQLLFVDIFQAAQCARACTRHAVANFVAGVIGIGVKIDSRVMVHAGGGLLLEAVKLDAIDGASKGRASQLCRNIYVGADGFRRSVVRADREKQIHKICAEMNSLRRLHRGES